MEQLEKQRMDHCWKEHRLTLQYFCSIIISYVFAENPLPRRESQFSHANAEEIFSFHQAALSLCRCDLPVCRQWWWFSTRWVTNAGNALVFILIWCFWEQGGGERGWRWGQREKIRLKLSSITNSITNVVAKWVTFVAISTKESASSSLLMPILLFLKWSFLTAAIMSTQPHDLSHSLSIFAVGLTPQGHEPWLILHLRTKLMFAVTS